MLQMFTAGGAAVAVGDYDNDGYEDLFLPTRKGENLTTYFTITETELLRMSLRRLEWRAVMTR